MSGKAIGKAIVAQFKIGLTENMYQVKGLTLKAKTYQTQAGMYAQLYDRMSGVTGGDVGKAFKGYAEIQGKIDAATRVDIDIKVPQEITSGLARARQLAPDAAAKQLAGLASRINTDKLNVKIPAIAPLVMQVSQQVVKQLDATFKPFAEPIETMLPKLPKLQVLAPIGQFWNARLHRTMFWPVCQSRTAKKPSVCIVANWSSLPSSPSTCHCPGPTLPDP